MQGTQSSMALCLVKECVVGAQTRAAHLLIAAVSGRGKQSHSTTPSTAVHRHKQWSVLEKYTPESQQSWSSAVHVLCNKGHLYKVSSQAVLAAIQGSRRHNRPHHLQYCAPAHIHPQGQAAAQADPHTTSNQSGHSQAQAWPVSSNDIMPAPMHPTAVSGWGRTQKAFEAQLHNDTHSEYELTPAR